MAVLAILFLLGLVFLPIAAVRIVLGWIVPRDTMARLDRAVRLAAARTFSVLFKLCIVVGGAYVAYLFWQAFVVG
jgi:hypothetical protein